MNREIETEQFHNDLSVRRIRAKLENLSIRIGRLEADRSDGPFDIQKFIENLTIINKRGETVSLIMNPSQELVFHKLMERRHLKIPSRFICCKSRQLGISTLIEAFIFALILHYPNRFGLIAANSLESAQRIFSMTRRFQLNLRPRFSTPMSVSARRLEYAPPHYSKLEVDTAGNKNLGRGGTLHYVHATETAFWERPEEPILAINQAVPQHWDTLIFWESTANGIHNLFHRTWIAAERGDSDMEPIFLSWKKFPEYSIPALPDEKFSMTEDEQKFADDHELTRDQMKWALFTKKNQCHNSWEKFHQEYPAASHLAFIFTGMPWFDREVLADLLEKSGSLSPETGHLRLGSAGSPIFTRVPYGPLSIWKNPEPDLTYSLGMDVGEGVGADYSVIQVICNETCELVAVYRSNRVKAEAAGIDAFLLGAYYNFGLLGIERNGPGLAVLTVCERGSSEFPELTGYPNLYYHTYTDRKIPEQTRRLGWITNRISKEAMLSRLAEVVEANGLTIHCPNTLLEMQGFVWDAEKKNFKQNYKPPESKLTHDDSIMALAIANEMRTHNFERRFLDIKFDAGGEF